MLCWGRFKREGIHRAVQYQRASRAGVTEDNVIETLMIIGFEVFTLRKLCQWYLHRLRWASNRRLRGCYNLHAWFGFGSFDATC